MLAADTIKEEQEQANWLMKYLIYLRRWVSHNNGQQQSYLTDSGANFIPIEYRKQKFILLLMRRA
jgi:hypothetical protein